MMKIKNDAKANCDFISNFFGTQFLTKEYGNNCENKKWRNGKKWLFLHLLLAHQPTIPDEIPQIEFSED